MCSTFEIMGPNLLDLLDHFHLKEKKMEIPFVKNIVK